MLEFSDAPYHFFEPKPSRPIMALSRWFNRCVALPGARHRIAEIRVEGQQALEEKVRSGARLMLVPNHPSHSDPQVMSEVHRRLGLQQHFMAAYDVFLRSSMQAWIMQRNGAFSVDREGSDGKSMRTALDLLKNSDMGLTIFPEGNVYLTNDKVTPFLEGAAFIAIKAQKDLGLDASSPEVMVVPVALKFTYLEDVGPAAQGKLREIGTELGLSGDPSDDPVEELVRLGRRLAAEHLERRALVKHVERLEGDELWPVLAEAATSLLDGLESELHLEVGEGQDLVDRVRKVRGRIHQLRIDPDTRIDEVEMRRWADRAILAFRILGYGSPYLTEHPSLDRYAETAKRLLEDHRSQSQLPFGPRRAHAVLGEPIALKAFLGAYDRKARGAVNDLTLRTEAAVQAGIDAVNRRNEAPGARLIRDLAERKNGSGS